ncbi:AMP-binding protein, partial [Xenorhabdus sp. PR6a]|uniref:phosphopantetheine-binding protein n=1 Tax=Xenorhabdus sp. PR6a TaxID=3025877 RepID=UPI0023585301
WDAFITFSWLCVPNKYVSLVPIGRPISNTQIYILDSYNQPVPIGVVGEIHIGGAGVARGYLNRPELTAERFIADPFSQEAEARLYKTGDLGRWLPDGNIEYLGRNDFQVKIRGFRIELGEIEARLAACDGVREAVVVAREDTPGDKRLVAYLVPQAGMALDIAVLRAELSTSLADYMLPGAFMVLEALPLTPNGKLDRQALPAPDQGAVVTRQYEAPQGEVEQQLAQIWQDLLGVERIGRHDNFFELGGHSLLAMSLVEKSRQSLGVEIVLGDIFTGKTISKLATSIQSSCNLNQYPNLFSIRTGGKGLPLFFVHDGSGSIRYAYDLVTWMDDINIPVYGFSAGNLLEKEKKEGS